MLFVGSHDVGAVRQIFYYFQFLQVILLDFLRRDFNNFDCKHFGVVF